MFRWAEDDLGAGAPPCLESHSQPADGNVYIMYHGTTRAAADQIKKQGFCQSKDGMLGRGVYLSRDLQKASKYPLNLPEEQRVVLRVRVNVGKVIVINHQHHPRQKNWHDQKYGLVYDTAWCPPNCGMVRSGLEEDCVWDPKRIQFIDEIRPQKTYCGSGDPYK
ncbi:grass carp reovirus (GCRV)-induced gene 2l [Danio rerio]|uniref:Grass carp reovirus (GCRV)-induced gene 2l n=1 Tax=Danio rerio TaxID=7955 RepID=A0AC58IB34_DANRE